jgi:hypothetical protein
MFPLSNEAYNNLCAKVAHPSRRTSTAEWDGWGVVTTLDAVDFRIAKGIGTYLEKFCALGNHPRTFTDERAAHLREEPLAKPHIINWQELNTLPPSPISSPINPAQYLAHLMQADGPLCILISPYDMENAARPMEGNLARQPSTTCEDVWYKKDRNEMGLRNINLSPLALDYLYMVATWWRIPAASVASYTRTEASKVTRAAGVLEALGEGWLAHRDLRTETVREKRAAYMRKWRANYQGPR